MVSIVYMVAGMSSRFGGKIKQFAKVGSSGETLIEISIKQAIKAGFNKIIFVVGEKTEKPFKEMFGNEYEGTPIKYALQTFDPNTRDKPWGTTDALVSAKDIINENFVVCNGDDIYGEDAFRTAYDFLKNNNSGIAIGYKLKNILPGKGTANRGLFQIDNNGNVTSIEEILGISQENFKEKNLTENSLCSMNLFGLPKDVLPHLKKTLDDFKEKNKKDRKIECYLPVELGKLIKEKKLQIKLTQTSGKWFGITNPDDEEILREQLKSLAQHRAN